MATDAKPAKQVRQFHNTQILGPVTLAAPAQRTQVVLLTAWRDAVDLPWRFHQDAFPVVAIESRRVDCFYKPAYPGQRTPGDPPPDLALVLEQGWTFDYSQVERRVLFCTEESCVPTDLEGYRELYGVDATRLVVCSWPADEDEARLAAIVETMKPRAIERAQGEEKAGRRELSPPSSSEPAP